MHMLYLNYERVTLSTAQRQLNIKKEQSTWTPKLNNSIDPSLFNALSFQYDRFFYVLAERIPYVALYNLLYAEFIQFRIEWR